LINNSIKTTKLHLERLKKAKEEIITNNILENIDIDDFETVKTIDTFVFRYIKLQDYLGNKLFRFFLNEIGEYKENMSFIDILDRLEKLEIISDVEEWKEIRELRNKIAHEYPEELEEIKLYIKLAMDYLSEIEDVVTNIEEYLKKRNII